MPFHLTLPATLPQRIVAQQPLVGAWVSSGSDTAAEIIATAGFDWVLIDAEHSPYGLETVTSLLRATNGTAATPVVRLPQGDTALIKQYLDLGAQNLMIPMVHTVEDAQRIVAAMHYPPRGVRGVGSALARSSRWNGVKNYLANASDTISLTVQIESAQAVENAAEIAALDGVDAVFVGPADLAASMGLLGQPAHPDVVAAVEHTFRAVLGTGKPVGVNTFDTTQAKKYLEAGASFVCVGADVQLLANSARTLAATFDDHRNGAN